MKNFGIVALLLAVLAPAVSARLTVLRFANGDQKLRGLSSTLPQSPSNEHKTVMRELFDFWSNTASMSISLSVPYDEPLPVEIPDYGFDFYSMSMSMPPSPSLPEDISSWWDLSYSFSMPVSPEDPEYVIVSGSVGSTTEEESDETAAKNLGDESVPETPSSSSNLGAALLVVLVVAALAVLSAWYVRKNQRASSNASLMTPMSTTPSLS